MLRLMDIDYDSISPEEAAFSSAKVVITTKTEADLVAINNRNRIVIFDTELEGEDPAVSKAKILKTIVSDLNYFADDQLTIGLDPGSRIGVSVIYLHQEIASWVASSPHEAIERVSELIEGVNSKRNILKIGDGDLSMAGLIAFRMKERFGRDVQVEIVDEHGTSLPRNTQTNRRGLRDKSSARNIAFRTGRIYHNRDSIR
jgi:hypothetical protein